MEDKDRSAIDTLMFGGKRSRRFTQDSPILPDVWIAYWEKIDEPVDVLLTPWRTDAPAKIAAQLRDRLEKDRKKRKAKLESPQVVFNQTTVAARLYFQDLIRVVLPMTQWWHETIAPNRWHTQLESIQARKALAGRMNDPEKPAAAPRTPAKATERPEPEIFWLTRIVAALEWKRLGRKLPRRIFDDDAEDKSWRELADKVAKLIGGVETPPKEVRIYSVNRNRPADLAVARSVLAVKGDAARRLFDIDCSRLTWAILDSGIDATHPAFIDRKEATNQEAELKRNPKLPKKSPIQLSRVRATYDFTEIRALLDPDAAKLPPRVAARIKKKKLEKAAFKKMRDGLRDRIKNGTDVDWSILTPFLQIDHDCYESPEIDHGTHVAGIIGADWKKEDAGFLEDESILGVCPDIQLYDVRAFDDEGTSSEFAVMAAMQFIRYLNSTNDYVAVHGINLSFSLLHDVSNYACGRTPVCDEAERLVSSGVVVVAAAGNKGYINEGERRGVYNPISITDPGNAEAVITVGATHREKPHSYGVSYFSSRGPTGDGRAKPDLVAPGEKILSAARAHGTARKDGTSQAAPHVSGAAALLMGRHRELVGQPARIKAILCATATDLGRERAFQGAGMLDILRALQSV